MLSCLLPPVYWNGLAYLEDVFLCLSQRERERERERSYPGVILGTQLVVQLCHNSDVADYEWLFIIFT